MPHNVFLRTIVTVVAFVTAWLIKKVIVYHINKRIEDVTLKHSYRKLTVYSLTGLALFLAGIIWLQHVNLGVLFSIIGAGLVISLSELILSGFGWFLLTVRGPFKTGERVQIGEIKGDVIDIRAFYIALLEVEGWVKEEQSTGRIVYLPNNFIFKNPIYNYSKGFNFIWNEVKITITFESNYHKAKEICLKYLDEFHNNWARDLDKKIRQVQDSYAIHYSRLTPTVYVKIVESGVELSLRYLVEPLQIRFSEDFLSKKLLDEFAMANDINFAYTTYRIIK